MKIQVRGNHLDVTEALHDYVDKKIGRLEKFFQDASGHAVHVTLSVVKDLHTVEVTLPFNGFVIRAEERSTDMYASIDAVSDKVEKQIKKHKTKLNKRMLQEGIHTLFKEVEEVPARAAAHDDEDEVVRVKRFAVKPMPLDEAIMQMDMLGHDFFVFTNSESEEVNVVYKRRDGQLGLIEPTFA
ncbi:ribosome hibernation-promoting factor, HPF/YfiA family [Tumebacillus permanentifrigoris]|uniref:Ribosome hibernation promoting factor n=1 Tax=Tumebacillus permanentifrigoris TaxID=378543 RepID=A0A316D577_9BACL|nr:ribosome-associated translation inhibitor RaiA [Tumebacillus permanentifrigoris]PWK05717.1 putative sigma-54 modulation protein [Tumebacillus permanentifrigoris]